MKKIDFRPGKITDLDEIFSFVEAAVTKMNGEGIFQWDEIYPVKEDFEDDIRNGNLTVGVIDGKIACVFTLSHDFDEAYSSGTWKGSSFMVLHRIVVNPVFQHRGIGRKTMLHIEEKLKSAGTASLRLDVFSENPHSLSLYKSLGFRRTGEAHWRKGLFYLMEKVF